MDHNDAVRLTATERYLLNELNPEEFEQFEEHFFTCPECAFDVRMAAMFVEQSKTILTEDATRVAVNVHPPARKSWLSWLNAKFAIPALAFAVLLAVIGYQDFVAVPQLRHAINRPQLLPAATVNLLTYGATSSPLLVNADQAFLLNVIIPPGNKRYADYRVELYSPDGKLAESLAIPPSTGDTWPIQFPGANWQNGVYRLTVHGMNEHGEAVEVGTGSVELEVQK
jgi:hypothetical protein